jgi:hypothetical protein
MLGVAGCGLVPANRATASQLLTIARVRPAVLSVAVRKSPQVAKLKSPLVAS